MKSPRLIMVQGTMSGVGKSFIAAGLCRLFAREGYRTAPFKSQNMALNSYVTADGLEMGRAQVMQAEAAGVEPVSAMNPILLKPTGEQTSEVIVNGRPVGVMGAADYFKKKKGLIPDIRRAFESLSAEYDVIVIEGAGSPAEINLKKNDIVNMGIAELFDAPVILVGDIDRGGVFAQLLGTQMLLEEEEKKRLKGFVINKFRGDKALLRDGLDMLTQRAGLPVLGVVDYERLNLPEEDSLSDCFDRPLRHADVEISVIHLPRISNFTDFDVFEQFEDVAVNYVTSPEVLSKSNLIIIPGSKNTVSDLRWMKQAGLFDAVRKAASSGIPVFGICGGFQMLGLEVVDKTMRATPDPDEPESRDVSLGASFACSEPGLGLLDVRTIITEGKKTTRVSGRIGELFGVLEGLSGMEYEGYEIHMGETGNGAVVLSNGNNYGTYVHGIFDSAHIAAAVVKALGGRDRGSGGLESKSMAQLKAERYDRLADLLARCLDMEMIKEIMGF